MKRVLALLIIPILCSVQAVHAQNGNRQISYSNLALQFSDWSLNGDAGTGIYPSVSSAKGFGSYKDNPASVALLDNTSFNFSLFNNRFNYENEYLGNTMTADDQSTKLGSIGFVYELPTTQGSFVMGGGFNRVSYYNAINQFGGRNNESSITDAFKDPSSDYYDIAYNTYAIDWGDVDSTYLESIFRIGFDEYPGINQEGKMTHETDIGEYSFFFGTEFRKGFFIGLSASIIAGDYSYKRSFLEIDRQDDYNYNFIPSTESDAGTDIHSILNSEELDAEIVGYTLRAGIIYKVLPDINVGVSYLVPTTMNIKESYYTGIKTELDDGSTPFNSDFSSDFDYRIKKPGKLNAGVTYSGFQHIELSLAGEYINYSNLEVDFISDADVDFDEEVALREQQSSVNDFMGTNYKDVINARAGIAYQVPDQFEVRLGYAYNPAKTKNFEVTRNTVSAGVTFNLSKGILLDLNGQYSTWDDRSTLYGYRNENNVTMVETLDQKFNELRIMAGVQFLF